MRGIKNNLETDLQNTLRLKETVSIAIHVFVKGILVEVLYFGHNGHILFQSDFPVSQQLYTLQI